MGNEFDVIVIGGGHAGAEAAWAAARLGAATALVAFDPAAIGRMSCNPAIGGIGKGQMVREIDALGGLMGLATDRAGIQFRVLNSRKGPAVQAPRAQCDRELYAAAVQALLADTRGLTLVSGAVEDILVAEPLTADIAPRARGVRLVDGRILNAPAIIVTTGTFLRAIMHCGPSQTKGGRIGEPSAEGLSACLKSLGLELGRLKTGTPPRVARDSLDYAALLEQPGDHPPRPFSFLNDRIDNPQVCCWITHTNEAAHAMIRANLHRAPMYSGQIASRGPRYCPSIEDKVVRFAGKSSHQMFLEPEGYASDRIYCNGISTSLPPDVQEAVVHSIRGLERARVLQWGYAVEYDFVPPHQTLATLETKRISGLYLAGQINGTSGYEEAAGQGLVAGVNAARAVAGHEPLILSREASYIGVMIDDLVTRGVSEPYRMFTSRAEHRLALRSDNADVRLTPLGRDVGLVEDQRWRRFQAKRAIATTFGQWIQQSRRDGRPLIDSLKRPDVDWPAAIDAAGWSTRIPAAALANDTRGSGGPGNGAEIEGGLMREALETAINDLRYAGYLRRQEQQFQRVLGMETRTIPANLDFAAVAELRAEARERWSVVRPHSVGQARRVSGVTPADVSLLLLHLDRVARGTAEVA